MLRTIMSAGLLACCISAAFAQKAPALPSFEVASIKPAAPMGDGMIRVGMQGGPGTPDPVQMTFTNVSLKDLIQNAWDVKGYQVTGPAWLESARFDIAAKLADGTTKEQSRLMLQNLLAERFKLVLHHSTKESSIYALLVAKGGSKLKESAVDPNATVAEGPPAAGRETIGKDGMPVPNVRRGGTAMMMAPGGRLRMVSNGVTMGKFIDSLANQLDRPVVDMTALTGTYDITLDFAQDPAIMQARMAAMGIVAPPPGMGPDSGGAGRGGSTDADPAATIFSALPEQLGLRLEARKGPVDLLIVDNVEKTPTEN
jgi:uncharacterized protein (TIGR03435 family)